MKIHIDVRFLVWSCLSLNVLLTEIAVNNILALSGSQNCSLLLPWLLRLLEMFLHCPWLEVCPLLPLCVIIYPNAYFLIR